MHNNFKKFHFFLSFTFNQRGRRMLRLNFVVEILLLLFIGLSNGSFFDGDYVIDGYRMPKHDDLIFYSNPGRKEEFTGYCKTINPSTSDCDRRNIVTFEYVNFDRFLNGANQDWILKHDVLVLYPSKDVSYTTDVMTFNFPAYCLYFNNVENLKVLITVQNARIMDTGHDSNRYQVYFVDPEDKCRQYRPREITEKQMFNLNLFANKKWTRNAYYFIKNGKYICAYSLNYDDLLKGNMNKAEEIKAVDFKLIDTYPTQNYAPNFFCVDSLYGTFVSLYWNQQQPNSLPEAHYYIIKENDLKDIQLIDRMVLKGFHQDALIAIFNEHIDNQWYPAFSSYGRQINIWFKFPNEMRAFNGLWKNEDEKIVFSQVLNDGDKFRKLWRAKKSYIQQERPVGRFDAPSLPPPITISPPTRPPPTTTTTTTTTVRPTTTTTTTTPKPTTTTMPTTTLPPTTSSTTTMPSSTSTSSSTTSNDTKFIESTPPPANIGPALPSSQCKDSFASLWLLIAIIAIDVIEAIILILLIIFKYRGAKKMKNAMAKKKKASQKSSKKSKTEKPKPKKKKKKMPWTKESKKSIKEKSVTSKTEDTVAGAAAGKSVDEKTTHQTTAQTNYYTVNETFNQTSSKKK